MTKDFIKLINDGNEYTIDAGFKIPKVFLFFERKQADNMLSYCKRRRNLHCHKIKWLERRIRIFKTEDLLTMGLPKEEDETAARWVEIDWATGDYWDRRKPLRKRPQCSKSKGGRTNPYRLMQHQQHNVRQL